MVSQATKDILSAYNTYRSNNNQSTVKYTASKNSTTSTQSVSQAKAQLAQAQSYEAIENINQKMNANQQDIEMVVNEYRSRNPNTGTAQMQQELRVKNPQYGGLIDDQRNLQEQKITLEEKLVRSEAGDINKDAQSDFSGISNTSPMDSQAKTVPVTYGTQNPNDRVTGTSLEGTFADPNFGKNQSTIDAIYARQDQDRVDNAVQSNYFWQLRAGKVPIGKALYEPETKNTYYSGDTELSEMANKTQRMELTRMYLEDAGQTFDTPIGNVKTSPTKYYDARNRATKAEKLNLPMGDLNTFRPSLTKEGDFTGYIEPTEYRKRITTSSPSEFPSQQGDWNFYETGFGRTYTMSPKLNQFDSIVATGNVNANNTQFMLPKDSFTVATTGVMSFENTKPDNAKVIMGAGNVPSMLGGINLFMFGGSPLKGLAKEAEKVSDDISKLPDKSGKLPVGGEFGTESQTEPSGDLDWSKNKITEIPDDFLGQILKGSQAEAFNIVQSGDSLINSKEVEYAPTVTGDLLDAFGYDTSKNTYRDYTDDFGTNVGIFFESSATTLAGYSDPQVQQQVGQQLTQAGEKFQKYPVYYITTGAVEVGSMFIPVGKVGTAMKYTAKGLVAGTSTAYKGGKVTEAVKLAMQTPETKVMKQINAILPEGAMDIKKVVLTGADRGIYVKKDSISDGWLNKLTTKVNKLEKVEMIVDSKGNTVMPVMSKAKTTEYINLSNVKGIGSTITKGLDDTVAKPVTGWTMQVYAETGKDVANIFGRIETMLAQEAVPRAYAVAKQTDKIDDKVGVTIQIPSRIADSPEALSTFTTNLRKQLYTYDKRGTIQGARNLGELKTGLNLKGKVTDYRRFLKEDSISYRYGFDSKRNELSTFGTKLDGGKLEMLSPDFAKLQRVGGKYNVDDNLDLFKDIKLTDVKYVTTKGKARTDEFQGIEKIGKNTYLANLSFETADKGMGYAVMNVANTVDEISLIPKQFVPDAKSAKLVIPTKEGILDIAQYGAVYTISGKTLRSNSINSEMFKLGLQKAIKESDTGMVDESFLKKLGGGVDGINDAQGMGMKTLFAEAVSKKKINPKTTDKTALDEMSKIFEKGNFDDLYRRDPIFAPPNSARPTFLGQGANPLYKDAIDNQLKMFGGKTNDAGKLARAKDKFWYGFTDVPKQAKLPEGATWSNQAKFQNMKAFATVRDSSLAYLGGTKFGKKFSSSRLGKKTISTFGKPDESLATLEANTKGFTKAQDDIEKLLVKQDELKAQEISASGDFTFSAKILDIEKQISKIEKESGFYRTDRWIKTDSVVSTSYDKGKKVETGTDTFGNKFSVMEDTTSEYDKLIARGLKMDEAKTQLSALRSQKESIGEVTDEAISALKIDVSNIQTSYQSQVKILQSQKSDLSELAKGFKSKQVLTRTGLATEQGNPYAGLMAQLGGTKITSIPKTQSSQFIGSTKARITKLESQAKNFIDPYNQKLKNLNAERKELEELISSGTYSVKRYDGKVVQKPADPTKIAEAKSKLRGVQSDITRFTNEIKTNKGYQETLKEITSLKRKTGRMEPSTTKTVKVQATPAEMLKAQTQIADIDTHILKINNAMKNDPKLLSIKSQITDLSPKASKAWESKITSTLKKTTDKTFETDWNKFMKENVKISKDTNTYRFTDDAMSLPHPKIPKDKAGKRKSKQSLNDVFADSNKVMNDAIKKFNTKKSTAPNKKFFDGSNNDPSKPLSTIMADGTPVPKPDMKTSNVENIIGQYRTDSGRGNLPSGIMTGASLFGLPQAFAQGQQQSGKTQSAPDVLQGITTSVQSTTPSISPRIGSNSLFTQPKVKTETSQSIFGGFKIQPPVTQTAQKTGQIFNPFTGQKQTPAEELDIMQKTDQISTQIGATAQALDQQFRLNQRITFESSSVLATPTKSIVSPPKPQRTMPAIMPTPTFPVFGNMPLITGGKRKKKKGKKKKEKGEATAWAVPDVWFDAKGYYFSKGNAYVKGAKAKSPPKPKRVKKSKR